MPIAIDSNEVTQLIHAWQAGDADALQQLLPMVYGELKQIAARELRAHQQHDTLQPTALLHDVFVRLLGAEKIDIHNRKHLFTTAARVMQQVLIDRARAKSRDKRGGSWQQVDWLETLALPIEADTDIEALSQALQQLKQHDARMAEIVELRYFVGLEVGQVANLLELDERTVYRDWAMARAWLKVRMQ